MFLYILCFNFIDKNSSQIYYFLNFINGLQNSNTQKVHKTKHNSEILGSEIHKSLVHIMYSRDVVDRE